MAGYQGITLVRVKVADGPPRTAVRTSTGIYDLERAVERAGERAPEELRRRRDVPSLLSMGTATKSRLQGLFGGLAERGELSELAAEGELALPFRPRKVVAVGRNYAAHAKEMGGERGEPFFFMKAGSIAVGPGEAIVIPSDLDGEVHHEAELAVVVGRVGRRVPEERALDYVAGYACANDVTARTLQHRLREAKLPWFASKNVDTFLALGPGVTLPDSLPDPSELRVQCYVDGELRQDAPTSDMIHGVARLLSRASRFVTLEPLDVILTGTPAGVGPIEPGQRVEVRIEGVGSLQNPVVGEAKASATPASP